MTRVYRPFIAEESAWNDTFPKRKNKMAILFRDCDSRHFKFLQECSYMPTKRVETLQSICDRHIAQGVAICLLKEEHKIKKMRII